MELTKNIGAFSKLGEFLGQFEHGQKKKEELRLLNISFYERFENLIKTQFQYNGWFTEENVKYSLSSISKMLEKKSLEKWIGRYKELSGKKRNARKVAVIMAGNIPLVGFHDFLCVLVSGHYFVGKLSSDDKHLLPLISEIMFEIEPDLKPFVHFQENKISEIDAVIATGSNNSSRYFEYYFGKYPHIIRKNRNAIAILDGSETAEELQQLGRDIFRYFGLGCRNVSKLFVPEGYKFDKLFEAVYLYKDVLNNNKYANNYNYNRTIYLMKGEKFLDNNFLLLKEDKRQASPVAVVFHEQYKNEKQLLERIKEISDSVQCIVSKNKSISAIGFGEAQCPGLSDYADGVDTMKFLTSV